MNVNKVRGVLAATAMALTISSANAAVIAGINFDDDAFADTLIGSQGTYVTSGGSLADVMTDNDAGTWALSTTPDAAAYLHLGFTDNVIVNGAGADIGIFEIGIADSFALSLSIDGVQMTYSPVDTGYDTDIFFLNYIAIDLDDFGIAAGATIDEVVIFGHDAPGGQGCCQPTIGLVGALNSLSVDVPEPATLALLGLGIVGVSLTRKRVK